jgi:anti-anti-sigma factor
VTAFEVEVVDTVDPVVVSLVGELDIAGADQLKDTVKPYLTRGRAVVVDLAGLSFADSVGLGALVSCHKTAKLSGSGFWVEGARGEVAAVLQITRLCDVLSKPRWP